MQGGQRKTGRRGTSSIACHHAEEPYASTRLAILHRTFKKRPHRNAATSWAKVVAAGERAGQVGTRAFEGV